MTTKAEILKYITTLAEQKAITREELNEAFDAGSGFEQEVALKDSARRIGIGEILYYIGGGVIFLGIVILVAQNWTSLGFGPKVLATLGTGIAAYYVGLLFSRDERTATAAPAFFLISGLVVPIGLFVVFDNAGIKTSGYGYQTLISALLLATYLLSYFVFRKAIFVLLSIIYGTWFFFSVTSYLFTSGPRFDEWKFYMYRALAAGIAYVLLGHAFSNTENEPLSGFLNNFGLLGFLGAALALGGWRTSQNAVWELIFPGIVFGIIFLSVHVQRKSFLVWGTIFLMAYLLKITSEYFSKGLGWPFALVVAGFTLIGVGYISISINRKYLAAPD